MRIWRSSATKWQRSTSHRPQALSANHQRRSGHMLRGHLHVRDLLPFTRVQPSTFLHDVTIARRSAKAGRCLRWRARSIGKVPCCIVPWLKRARCANASLTEDRRRPPETDWLSVSLQSRQSAMRGLESLSDYRGVALNPLTVGSGKYGRSETRGKTFKNYFPAMP